MRLATLLLVATLLLPGCGGGSGEGVVAGARLDETPYWSVQTQLSGNQRRSGTGIWTPNANGFATAQMRFNDGGTNSPPPGERFLQPYVVDDEGALTLEAFGEPFAVRARGGVGRGGSFATYASAEANANFSHGLLLRAPSPGSLSPTAGAGEYHHIALISFASNHQLAYHGHSTLSGAGVLSQSVLISAANQSTSVRFLDTPYVVDANGKLTLVDPNAPYSVGGFDATMQVAVATGALNEQNEKHILALIRKADDLSATRLEGDYWLTAWLDEGRLATLSGRVQLRADGSGQADFVRKGGNSADDVSLPLTFSVQPADGQVNVVIDGSMWQGAASADGNLIALAGDFAQQGLPLIVFLVRR